MQAIFEGEIKEYATDIYSYSEHYAEVDGVNAFLNMLIGKIVESMLAIVGMNKLGFRT